MVCVAQEGPEAFPRLLDVLAFANEVIEQARGR